MAKLSFEEFMKAREEYEDYLKGSVEASSAAGSDQTPAPAKQPEPEKQPEPAQEQSGPDYDAQLDDIRQQLQLMAKALSPSLGDIQPVGVDDVVKKFFTE